MWHGRVKYVSRYRNIKRGGSTGRRGIVLDHPEKELDGHALFRVIFVFTWFIDDSRYDNFKQLLSMIIIY